MGSSVKSPINAVPVTSSMPPNRDDVVTAAAHDAGQGSVGQVRLGVHPGDAKFHAFRASRVKLSRPLARRFMDDGLEVEAGVFAGADRPCGRARDGGRR